MQDNTLNDAVSECKFWGNYTDIIKPSAKSSGLKIKYLLLAAAKFLLIWLIKDKKWNENSFKHPESDVVAICLTKNQKKAIEGWFESDYSKKILSNDDGSEYLLPWGLFAFYCLKSLPAIYLKLLNHSESEKYLPWIEEFVRYEAGKTIFEEFFLRAKMLAVVVSNDHSGVSRAIMRTAAKAGIKIIYTQHAPIGVNFPKLNYDLCMLDGLQSLDQYLDSGPVRGALFLTGRLQYGNTFKKSENVKVVGLATNSLDDFDKWEEVLQNLQDENWKLILRCHPADKRKKKWIKLIKKYNGELREGHLNDFLSDVDILIAGVSGVILDAHVARVPSILIRNEKIKLHNDYYGFLKNEITRECVDANNLKTYINEAVADFKTFDNAALYDSGVVSNPHAVKKTILNWYIMGLKDLKPYDLDEKFVEIFHRGVNIYCVNEYANIIKKFIRQSVGDVKNQVQHRVH